MAKPPHSRIHTTQLPRLLLHTNNPLTTKLLPWPNINKPLPHSNRLILRLRLSKVRTDSLGIQMRQRNSINSHPMVLKTKIQQLLYLLVNATWAGSNLLRHPILGALTIQLLHLPASLSLPLQVQVTSSHTILTLLLVVPLNNHPQAILPPTKLPEQHLKVQLETTSIKHLQGQNLSKARLDLSLRMDLLLLQELPNLLLSKAPAVHLALSLLMDLQPREDLSRPLIKEPVALVTLADLNRHLLKVLDLVNPVNRLMVPRNVPLSSLAMEPLASLLMASHSRLLQFMALLNTANHQLQLQSNLQQRRRKASLVR